MGYFDERDPQSNALIAHLIRIAHETAAQLVSAAKGRPISPSSQNSSFVQASIAYPSTTTQLSKHGKNVASVEQKIVLERLAEQAALAAGTQSKNQSQTGHGPTKLKRLVLFFSFNFI